MMRAAQLGWLSAAAFLALAIARADELSESAAELKKLSVEELMGLEVTSVSKRPEKLAATASAIQVITHDEIQESGAQSLPEALRLADNLQVAQKNSHDWAISSRGFNTSLSNKLLVLVDGRSVYTPLYSGVFWNAQDYPLADLDRIEVISGPGSTLWGANAVNGVINITTKSASNTQGLYLEGGGGSHWQDFGTVRYGGMLAPNVYFRIYGKYFEGDAEVLASGERAHDAWRQGRGGFRIDAQSSSDDTLTLQGDLYGGSGDHTATGELRFSGGNILGRWSHTLSQDSDMSLQTYFDRTHISLPTAAMAFAPAGVIADDLNTYDVDFQHHLRMGERHRVVWGLGYRLTHDVVSNALSLSFFPPTLTQNLFSGFVQDEVMLRPEVFFTAGTKLEHNDYTGYEVEPSVRLLWIPGLNQTLWSAVSRAVRTPSRIDHDLAEPAPSTGLVLLQGGSGFKSETVVAYELGYRTQVSTKLATSLSTFYNRYDHVRSTAPSPEPTIPGLPFPLVFQNDLEGHTYGLEFSADYQLLPAWRLHAGYTLLKENLHVKAGRFDFSDAHNETADPQQQFSLRSALDLGRNLDVSTALRWVDTLHINNAAVVGIVPSYFELNARLGWHPTPKIELSVVGENLLHAQHPEYGFPDPSRIEIRRSLFGRIQCQF
ncbi:MAG: Iron complex outerrane recepter protein [Gammaproteobacteria bacterium]|nr:Iron complex outerrane recepter protein [Gammaproteobacteria bacterium]